MLDWFVRPSVRVQEILLLLLLLLRFLLLLLKWGVKVSTYFFTRNVPTMLYNDRNFQGQIKGFKYALYWNGNLTSNRTYGAQFGV